MTRHCLRILNPKTPAKHSISCSRSAEEKPIDDLAKKYKTHLEKGLSSKKAAAPGMNLRAVESCLWLSVHTCSN